MPADATPSGLRLSWGRVQTSVCDVREPGGREITVVACYEVGTADYYRRLGELIAGHERAGAAVHHTRVAPVFHGRSELPLYRQHALQALWEQSTSNRVELLQSWGLDLVVLRDGVPVAGHWSHTGVDLAFIVATAGLSFLEGMCLTQREVLLQTPETELQALRARRGFLRNRRREARESTRDKKPEVSEVESRRRVLAVHAGVEALSGGGKLVLLVDPDQVRGILDLLSAERYSLHRVGWFTALPRPVPTLKVSAPEGESDLSTPAARRSGRPSAEHGRGEGHPE